jgi:peptidyl-prolyl cis-trans isomerase A (cyclophilin A)
MRVLLATLAVLFLLSAAPPAPGVVRVKLNTSAGAITLALDARRAPKTVANFLAYVDDGRLDGTTFYRASRRKGSPGGFVQGGIGSDARRMLPPVPIEPTNVTGLKHLDGTISMAHHADPNSGTGNFSIMVGPNPGLDARGASKGFAAFGRVIGGMDVVKRMLAMPTGGGRGDMKGQMFLAPVKILGVQRLDGEAKPTGGPKPWLIQVQRRQPKQ